MSAQIAASRGPRSSTWASGRSTKRHRPTTPAGVTLSLSEASAWSSTRVQVPAAAARSAYCSVAAASSKTSTTHPGTERAPSTAFGPSARKSRRSVRTERRLSLRASLTRALPTVRGFRDRRCAPSSTTGLRGDLGRVDVLGQGGLGGLDERVERGDVVDGQVGEDLAVHLDAGQVQSLDEPVVGHALGAGGRVDALDPQLAEVALVLAPVVVAVDQRVGDLLLRLAVEARTLSAVTAGALEDDPALLLGVHCPLDACHVVTPCCLVRGALVSTGKTGVGSGSSGSETQHLLRALDVGLGELGGARHPTRHLRGLLLEVVALAGLLPQDLARAGDPEPLASTGVRLVLRHLFRSLSRGQAARGRPIVSSAWVTRRSRVRRRSRGRDSRSARAPSSSPPARRRARRRARPSRRPRARRARRPCSPSRPSCRPWRRPSSCAGRAP